MIRIDPVTHLDRVSSIIQNEYVAVGFILFAFSARVLSIGWVATLFLEYFVYIFPVYLIFTLFINNKTGWAVGLIVWMGLGYVPMHLDTGISHLQPLFGFFPLLFLVLFCGVLNIKLRDWGYKKRAQRSRFWF